MLSIKTTLPDGKVLKIRKFSKFLTACFVARKIVRKDRRRAKRALTIVAVVVKDSNNYLLLSKETESLSLSV